MNLSLRHVYEPCISYIYIQAMQRHAAPLTCGGVECVHVSPHRPLHTAAAAARVLATAATLLLALLHSKPRPHLRQFLLSVCVSTDFLYAIHTFLLGRMRRQCLPTQLCACFKFECLFLTCADNVCLLSFAQVSNLNVSSAVLPVLPTRASAGAAPPPGAPRAVRGHHPLPSGQPLLLEQRDRFLPAADGAMQRRRQQDLPGESGACFTLASAMVCAIEW